MPEIKWIKITTEMFDDEKIRIIEAMPEADTLIVIWVRLICMAGKVNAGGHIFLAPNVPYDDDQFAAVFNRPVMTVRLALETFKRLGMIIVNENGTIYLPAFEAHQNIEGMERVRLAGSKRQQEFRKREKRKLLTTSAPEALRNVTVTGQNRIDKNRKEENREEINNTFNNIKENLKRELSKHTYNTYFADCQGMEINDSEFVIGVKTEAVARHLEENCMDLLTRQIATVTEKQLTPRFVLIEAEE